MSSEREGNSWLHGAGALLIEIVLCMAFYTSIIPLITCLHYLMGLHCSIISFSHDGSISDEMVGLFPNLYRSPASGHSTITAAQPQETLGRIRVQTTMPGVMRFLDPGVVAYICL